MKLIIFLIFLILISGCAVKESNEKRILEIANQNLDVKNFVEENPDYKYEISALNTEEKEKLAINEPVIYSGLPDKVLYIVQYKSGNEGLLVIIDVENNVVLRNFRTTSITI